MFNFNSKTQERKTIILTLNTIFIRKNMRWQLFADYSVKGVLKRRKKSVYFFFSENTYVY